MEKMDFFDYELGYRALWHPTFLYESICTLLIFIVLMVITRKKRYNGQQYFDKVWIHYANFCCISSRVIYVIIGFDDGVILLLLHAISCSAITSASACV